MYIIELENGVATGNYSIDVEQPTWGEVIELSELPSNDITGYKWKNGEWVKPDYDANALNDEKFNLEQYLFQTDWYVIRSQDNGKDIPSDVKTKREEARERISEIVACLSN